MRRKKCWQVHPEQPEQVKELSARHGLPPLVARLLLNRGLNGAEEIQAFLDPSLERLYPPFGLADLEVAAGRLGQAVRRGEPVAIYGDYDADGITATCVLHQFFTELGLPVCNYIPDRLKEGYGLKIGGLKELASKVRLLVTVDCGISDVEEAGLGPGAGAGGHRHRPPRDSRRSCPRPWPWSIPNGAARIIPSATWPGWGWPCCWPWGCGPNCAPRAGSAGIRNPTCGHIWIWWPWGPRPTWCPFWGKTASW